MDNNTQSPFIILKKPFTYIDNPDDKIYVNNQGSKYKVTYKKDYKHVWVQFLDDHRYTYMTTDYLATSRISVKNPFYPNRFGSYLGVGQYNANRGSKLYQEWIAMFDRTTRYKDGWYSNVAVCPQWYNYQVFADWYINYINGLNPEFKNIQFDLDKDLLQIGYNFKLYSPDACCLLPAELNRIICSFSKNRKKENNDLPIGVYRKRYHGKLKYDRFEFKYNLGGRNGHSHTSHVYYDPIEAFKGYREIKLKIVDDIANKYYQNNMMYENVYDILINLNFDQYGNLFLGRK